jgi:hypothetical protein
MRPEQSEETTILMADWFGPKAYLGCGIQRPRAGHLKVIVRFEAGDVNFLSGAEIIDLVHLRHSHRSRRESA